MLKSGQDDLLWFQAHLEELHTQYLNQFVAVLNGTIVAFSSDLDQLLETLAEKNIKASSVLIKFVSKVKMIL